MSNDSVKNQQASRRGFLSTLLLALVIILVAAGAGAGGYWYLFGRHAAGFKQRAEAEQPSVVKVKAPIYTELKPFTVNISDSDGHMLYVGLSLQVNDDQGVQALNEHLPEVRNRILMLLSSQKLNQLSTPQDKERLANDIRNALASPYDTSAIIINVRQVLFTDFIVQ